MAVKSPRVRHPPPHEQHTEGHRRGEAVLGSDGVEYIGSRKDRTKKHAHTHTRTTTTTTKVNSELPNRESIQQPSSEKQRQRTRNANATTTQRENLLHSSTTHTNSPVTARRTSTTRCSRRRRRAVDSDVHHGLGRERLCVQHRHRQRKRVLKVARQREVWPGTGVQGEKRSCCWWRWWWWWSCC